MAEEKRQPTDARAGRRKTLVSLIVLALGAVAGGAAVVVAVPAKTVPVQVREPVYEFVDVVHPDPILHEFNPRSKVGKGIARVQLKFVYTVREDRESKAFARIEQQWEQVISNVLVLLKSRSMEELRSEVGVAMLEKELIDDLDRTLFPGKGDQKVARVTRVMWSKWLLQ
ncbi:MAG TPA: flagellar basal body-associated FliL family protein [Planctomycetota bacterium]|nr:flagellar basal body-associated FliL family protein [Planctomycetota bacterium]